MNRHDRRAEAARHAGRLRLPAELHALVASGALHVLVLHDAQCTPPRCICSPELEVRDLTAETLLEESRIRVRRQGAHEGVPVELPGQGGEA